MTTRQNPLFLPFMLVALALIASFASAQDSLEIEVYGSETLPKGETAVELHSNFNAEAEDNPTPGVYPSQDSLNESVEIAHGFADWLQGSFYVLTSINTAYGLAMGGRPGSANCMTVVQTRAVIPAGNN